MIQIDIQMTMTWVLELLVIKSFKIFPAKNNAKKNMVAYCLKIAIYMCLLLVMKLLGREKEPWVEEKEREE